MRPALRAFGLVLFLAVTPFLLAACATPASLVGETPAQKLYGLKADYEAMLSLANAYKNDCEARSALLRQGCEDIVAEIQRVDAEQVFPAYQAAKAAGGTDLTVAAARAAIRQLETYILQHQAGQQSVLWVGLPMGA